MGWPARGMAGVSRLSLLLTLCWGAAAAEPGGRSPEAWARELVEGVSQGTAEESALEGWSRSVIEKALERTRERAEGAAGRAGGSPPLPAELEAGAVTARSAGTEVLVFMSLSVPAPSWREWAGEAAHLGAPIVLRGMSGGGLPATVKAVGERIGDAEVGVAIDPRLFRLFAVERVPAVAVVPGGVPACRKRGCAGDRAPPHDLVSGNIGLVAALEAVKAEGGTGRGVAGAKLARLRGAAR